MAAKPPVRIVAIGDKLIVRGERGEWDVYIDLEFQGRTGTRSPIRFNPSPEAFQKISLREEAREVREILLLTFAQNPERPVYVNVYAPGTSGGDRPFTNKDHVVLPIVAADFDHTWTLPKSVPVMVKRKSRLKAHASKS